MTATTLLPSPTISAVDEVTNDVSDGVTTSDTFNADVNSLPYSAFLKEIHFRGLGCTTHFGPHAIAVISWWMKHQQGDVCLSASSYLLNKTSVHASPCPATHEHCVNCNKVIGRNISGVHVPN